MSARFDEAERHTLCLTSGILWREERLGVAAAWRGRPLNSEHQGVAPYQPPLNPLGTRGQGYDVGLDKIGGGQIKSSFDPLYRSIAINHVIKVSYENTRKRYVWNLIQDR